MNFSKSLRFLKRQSILLIILTLTSILIWFRGPELAIADVHILHPPHQRGYAIALVWLIWILKILCFDANPQRLLYGFTPTARKKLERLQGKFFGAMDFLKKTNIKKQDQSVSLLSLPWFLFVGPMQAGKTTLLANANINYILAKQPNASNGDTVTSSDLCDWWITRDLVLVDIPGAYLTSNAKNSTLALSYQALWRHLLELIYRYRHEKLQGIILAVHLPEILRKRLDKQTLVTDLKNRLNDIIEQFGTHLPIHLVITKCDLMPGFTEFFNEFNNEELAQNWGITIPKISPDETFTQHYQHRFNALIKRLNKQLITRLHRERDVNTIPAIKDFPLYVEQLKENILHLIKGLTLHKINLRSVNLTCGTQQADEAFTTILAQNLQAASTQPQPLVSPKIPPRAHFVKQFLLHTLNTTLPLHNFSLQKYYWKRRILYSSALGAILLAAFFLGKDFNQSMQHIHAMQMNLKNYELSLARAHVNTRNLSDETLILLESLKPDLINQSPLVNIYSYKTQETINQLYQQALNKLILPSIKQHFENYLLDISDKYPENIYTVLKAYLMMGEHAPRDVGYILKTLQQFPPAQLSANTLNGLIKHSRAVLYSPKSYFSLNNLLINKIRQQLLSLSKKELAFVLLKNKDNYNATKKLDLGTHYKSPTVFTSKAIEPEVPVMFTGKAFEKILDKDIPEVANEILRGNWILGSAPLDANNKDLITLTIQVRSQYLANYIDLWESLLANISLNKPTNLEEMTAMLSALTSDNSPLLQLLNTIKQNTSFSPIREASPKLKSIDILLLDAHLAENSALFKTFTQLKQLNNYLKAQLTDASARKVFEATAKRMQDPTGDILIQFQALIAESPEPMKTWLSYLTQETWSEMLQRTGQFIENAYQLEIMSVYRHNIAGRYPFKSTAITEVDLPTFTRFFGQPGLLSNFYQNYLKPFVEEEPKKLTWRSKDGQKLPFSDAILEQITQGNRLQHIFFPNGDNKLYVPFSLQPFSLDASLKASTLNINGQEIHYEKNTPQTTRLITWPGNNPLHSTSINLINQRDEMQSNTLEGTWAWFKLVNHATESVRSRKELVLAFNVNGHTAKYVLHTQGRMNPFLPLNLSRFELPRQLV